ncbi:MAG: twin-arginine translocase subunit TatB [Amylibacter sp.]|nr:twin-arginine translocase subunit TatB [Amylibacter sp.]
MFDIGWSELMIIGVVALIVVGPKDLPMMFRKAGNFVGKARGMARDFQSAMNDAADQSGVKDLTDTLKKATDIKDDLSIKGVGGKVKDYAQTYAGSDTKPAADVKSVKPPKAAAAEAPAKKTPAKKVPAKKTAAKKPAAKKPAAKKPAVKKAAPKKVATKKPTPSKAKS